MQSDSIQEKSAKYFVKNPCKPSESCVYDDDYDPCGSTDDLTEKDLAVLLREEAVKLHTNISQNDETIANSDYKDDDANVITSQAEIEERDKLSDKKKKKVCKNFIKNPFFTSPLKFSSNLPPPPAAPPEQFFPLTETASLERSMCQKEKKKKKPCKKKTEQNDGKVEEKCSEPYCEEDNRIFDLDDDKGAEADVEDETDEDQKKEDKKKKCRKRSERPPCRKKVSDISISLLPPQIPPLQRDLPLTSPKDIPEVERQMLMACGVKPDKKCRKPHDKPKTKISKN